MSDFVKKIRLNLLAKILTAVILFQIGASGLISDYGTVIVRADTLNTTAASSNVQLIKNKMLNDILSYKTDITFTSEECEKWGIVEDTETDPKNIYFDLLFEHPEIFWTSLGVTGGSYTDFFGNVSYTLYICNIYDDAQIDNKKTQLNAKISEVVNKFSDYDKLRKVYEIHDYINKNCTYDTAQDNTSMPSSTLDPNADFDAYIADEREKAKANAKYFEAHSIYGALISGKAVCEGYAKAAKILFNKSDIESGVIISSKHAWNYVKINNNYYQMDLTGDDSDDEASSYPYLYFNITKNELADDKENKDLHTATSNNVPNCTDPTFDNIFRDVDSNGNLTGKDVARIEDKLYYVNNSKIYSCNLDGKNPQSITNISSKSVLVFNLISYNNNLYVGDFEYDNDKMILCIKKINVKNNQVEDYLNLNNEFDYEYNDKDDTFDMNFYGKDNKIIINLTQNGNKVTKEFNN